MPAIRGGFPAWFFTRRALRKFGARAVRITPARPLDGSSIDGLVLGGGADVTVPLSGDPTTPATPRANPRRMKDLVDDAVAPLVVALCRLAGTRRHGVDTDRDALELALIQYAKERDMPVLGICRGAQLMNVAEGGTLVSDLKTLYEERPDLYTVRPRRKVDIVASSRLARIVGRDSLLVNSLHFHAIDRPGRDLRVVARESNGLPQAIEHTARRFWLGVQWHPEYLPQQRAQQLLFRALVECARDGRVAAA